MNTAVFWADKYRPKNLNELTFHPELDAKLYRMAQSANMPHLIFSGPGGAGKLCRIRSLLAEIHDNSVNKVKIEMKAFQTASGKKLDLAIFSSLHHIEMNPSDLGIYDRFVVQEIIKDFSRGHQVIPEGGKKKFKVVVILEAEKMTREAQQALRRTMEKYSSNVRIILCCNSTSSLISPIKSRCLFIRVPLPTLQALNNAAKDVLTRENRKMDPKLVQETVDLSGRDCRKMLLSLQCSEICNETAVEASKLDWEMEIDKLSLTIVNGKTAADILAARNILYDLLTKAIPAQFILINLVKRLAEKGILIQEVFEAAALYDFRLAKGNKAIFHLEAFVATVIAKLAKQ